LLLVTNKKSLYHTHMTNISKAWTIQQKCEYMKRFGGRKKIIKRFKKQHGIKLGRIVREWKTRNDGTINDHLHFFGIYESPIGKSQFVESIFGETNRWLLRQARPISKGSYKTFDEYLRPDPAKPKYKTSPGKVIWRYPKLDTLYEQILICDRLVTKGSSEPKLFERLGVRISNGESIVSLIIQQPYLAIHQDKLLKIKSQFFRNITKEVEIVENLPEGIIENDIYNLHWDRQADGYHPSFYNYIDQKVLVMTTKFKPDAISFVRNIKNDNFVQVSKWIIKWLYVKYILIKPAEGNPNQVDSSEEAVGATCRREGAGFPPPASERFTADGPYTFGHQWGEMNNRAEGEPLEGMNVARRAE